ncbi:hypothetical protein IJG79_00155 [Candidatus Saccharibacteria bacterium]|nr:hypothetical protein [Candidatus Saccharibacteria bacterium]
MFVGSISLVKDNSNVFSDLGSAISILPIWLLIAAGIYLCLQIIHLVIYRDLRRVVLINVLLVLILTLFAFIIDREIAKTIQQSNFFNEDSFVGARLIEYIILTVILGVAALYSFIYMISHRNAIPKRGKKCRMLDERPLARSDKIILSLSGGLLTMIMVLSFFTCSGAKIVISIVDKEQGTILGRERYSLSVKEGEIIRLGDYIMMVEGWNEDGVNVKMDQRIKKETEDKLDWNTKYKIEDDTPGTNRFDCSVMFTK